MDFYKRGFEFVPSVFTKDELDAIIAAIPKLDPATPKVMGGDRSYAIRSVMQGSQELHKAVWTNKLVGVIADHFGKNVFLTKSIWFDKPPAGNWFVGYHQDISISVERKVEVDGYSKWTSKHGVIGVVPPVEVLERTLTIRIHIDDTDNTNGALRVKPGSHRSGILRDHTWFPEEVECPMTAGDVMLMKPLLLHSSMRSTTNKPRRVLHLEVTDMELPMSLKWAEREWILR